MPFDSNEDIAKCDVGVNAPFYDYLPSIIDICYARTHDSLQSSYVVAMHQYGVALFGVRYKLGPSAASIPIFS